MATPMSEASGDKSTAAAGRGGDVDPYTDNSDPYGVIDIGSNSVRLVIYEGVRRAPVPVFNEKVQCGIGKTLATTGRLEDEAVSRTMKALAQFRSILDRWKVGQVDVAATAAVRDAENGRDFVTRAEQRIGLPIRVLTGDQEAEFAALGVISGIPEADGLVGDLGGGSLELATVEDGKVGKRATLPIGGLRLRDAAGNDPKEARRIAGAALDGVPWLGDVKGKPLYAVGGMWRNFARIHMEQFGYDLNILHHYRMGREDVLRLAETLAKQSRKSYDAMTVISGRRKELMPFAAAALARVLEKVELSDVVVSAYGVREGLMHARLSPRGRLRDPLLEAAERLCVRAMASLDHARELAAWLTPLYPEESKRHQRLREAACRIADLFRRSHPEYRLSKAVTCAMTDLHSGLDHPGRIFLGLALTARYGAGQLPVPFAAAERHVDEATRHEARALGLAIRLGFALSAAAPGILPGMQIERTGRLLKLHLDRKILPFAGESAEKRLRVLAEHLGLDHRIV